AGGGKTVELDFAGAHHALADLRRALALRVAAAQLFVIHRWNVNVNVDAVHERPGNFRDVALDHRLGAMALALSRTVIATGAGVHGSGQHEARRKGQRHGGASDGYVPVFKWLSLLVLGSGFARARHRIV